MPKDEEPKPALFLAVDQDDAEAIGNLVAAKADVNQKRRPFGWTPLHEAAGEGRLLAATALIDAGANVNALSDDLETPLFLAASQAQEAAVRLLALYKADVSARNEDGETPLLAAVQHIGGKDTAALKALLELKADPLATDNAGQNAINHAHLFTNRAQELQGLLQTDGAGASAPPPSSLDKAPGGKGGHDVALRAACQKGMVEPLLSLLDWADEPRDVVAQRLLVPAAAGGHVDVMKALLKERADLLKAPTADGKGDGTTPLLAACDEGATKMVRFLLDQRCDASQTSQLGATALMAAAMKGSEAVCKMLLDEHADVNAQTTEGGQTRTALTLAAQTGKLEVVKLLLNAGAELEPAGMATGSTAKALAQVNGHHEVVRMLDQRAKLNSRKLNKTNDTSTAEEDSRDLDSLLAALGEPSQKQGKKKKAQAKSGASAVEAVPPPAVAASAPAPSKAAAIEEAPAAEAPKKNKKKTAAGATKEQRNDQEADKAMPELRRKLEDVVKKRKALEAEEKSLHARLAEIAKAKQQADTEELALRRQLDDA
eukprot:TRINITY_DN15084_c0_g1_i1.p1 TRINITY_DN15084_c0_g1~~TRINITY_DN15084_c0_g1_i1.p1  ORF type:complete len:544 (-),score=184.82 TRINITY_DN15084_c0_g1_i1:284-1915(-)